jgi:hypothetical protein
MVMVAVIDCFSIFKFKIRKELPILGAACAIDRRAGVALEIGDFFAVATIAQEQ